MVGAPPDLQTKLDVSKVDIEGFPTLGQSVAICRPVTQESNVSKTGKWYQNRP